MRKNRFIPAARFHILTPLFDALCSVIGLGKKYRERIVVKLNIPDGKVLVLDAGCGSGSLAIEVKKEYPNVSLYAIDADPHILKRAKEKAAHEKVPVDLREAYLQKLPFSDNSFDIIYSSLVFHHLAASVKQEAAKEVHRVLKKEGRFLLVDFGKPKHTFFSIFSWFTILFEEGYDNYQGRIPEMLLTAGFRKVEEIERYRFNIVFLEAVK